MKTRGWLEISGDAMRTASNVNSCNRRPARAHRVVVVDAQLPGWPMRVQFENTCTPTLRLPLYCLEVPYQSGILIPGNAADLNIPARVQPTQDQYMERRESGNTTMITYRTGGTMAEPVTA